MSISVLSMRPLDRGTRGLNPNSGRSPSSVPNIELSSLLSLPRIAEYVHQQVRRSSLRSRVPSKRNRFSVMHDLHWCALYRVFSSIRPFQNRPIAARNKVAVLLAAWRCLIHHDWHPAVAGHVSQLVHFRVGCVPAIAHGEEERRIGLVGRTLLISRFQ